MTAQRIFKVMLEIVMVTIRRRQTETQKSTISQRKAFASDRVSRNAKRLLSIY